MKLYLKTILILTICFVAVISLILASFQFFVMDSFSSLEKEYTTQDLDRAENSLSEEVGRIDGICRDWGAWDSVYEFINDRNQDFFPANFAPQSLKGLNISYVLLYDQRAALVQGTGYDRTNNSGKEIPDDLKDAIESYELTGMKTGESSRSGIILTPIGPMMIAIHPIVTSREEGPPRGTIIMAREIDDSFISHISTGIRQRISTVNGTVQERERSPSRILLPDIIREGRIIRDINGYPIFTLVTGGNPELYQRGVQSRAFLFISLFLLTFIFLVVTTILLYHSIIAPLRSLNGELTRIAESGSLTERVSMKRDDEIGELGGTINLMLNSLDTAERERLASEKKWKILIELADEGICILDSEKRIQFANQKLSSIFGLAEEDLIGQPISSLYTGHDGETIGQLKDKEFIPAEFNSRTRSGDTITLRVSSANFILDSGERGEICVVSDISSFKQNERDLLLSNKKLSLLGSMTRHDIVNQLTTIRGMLSLIMRKNTDPILTGLLTTADDAAEKIHKHIEFSKEYQKAGIEQPRWQNLKTTWNLAYNLARRREITFTIKGDDYDVWADQLLQNVFYNLIQNSLKHGKNVFYITVTIGKDPESGMLIVRYEDDGGGIRPEMKQKIFERGIGSGTGWGLFFVQEVLSLTGITITENGTWGIGACFEMMVPEGTYRRHEEFTPRT